MDVTPPTPVPGSGQKPVTEADLHAYADGQLAPARQAEIEAFLNAHAAERQRVDDWRAQNRGLKQLLNPVMAEPLPLRLPLAPAAAPAWHAWPWRSLAAGVAIVALSSGSAWWGRGAYDGHLQRLAAAHASSLHGFAQRAAIAHAVYSPEVRRPVEVGAEQEQALITWLTKRMGTTVRPPELQALGYRLIGGRLLPGGTGPVAQFMFERAQGERLTLYITREDAGRETAFKFGQQGPVNVFYWVDQNFGYALSSGASRQEMLQVAEAVYQQLERRK